MSSAKAMAQAQFQSLTAERLDAVLAVEQRAYAHPWNRSHFLDALQAGYQAQMLVADDALLGYFVAMEGFEEVHLLNITVAPEYRGQGWSRVMLDALTLWARGRTAQWLWLEVRVGNERAMRVYEAHGYRRVGYRRDYYPSIHGQREDAVVMSLKL
ncbi:ribosomal protein S18-alanine N-acetyltransferase [Candidatus Aalborgicola defluviihabitans]|jgi:ribosomal-protein-alanine N-acetyltransferase|uniref:ribosomal protein S18-alanine N-acetyltransferase n=1 Tax=Candidatus Aalborgicola defluviihabitans TaxID=3386187 RepID=UPI001DC728E5|nr:ribosomal protein S18-alanine N-acetyltransferase [Burkholderiales bacterium]MBK6570448.1 ribosomal protein S18-alanine N-acetyltransferase [Burkholderiales bacterium]MBK7279446.1 ribosomal protein S18-alanine N-acetyltransferase [Burkholderiales bacterium]MBK7312860.1 ribosomal protein S18-alanine N-acetyltransferase [Burkholderiales bacterium]MBL0243673.1 ribosomal protein S18-alanine N-acetyltransferase [Rhodoferax sp.]